MNTKTIIATTIVMLTILLSGCMYPQSEKIENQIPNGDQILIVQNAVDQYRMDNAGLIPIKNQDATVPYYQKYPIDFSRLSSGYISEPPGNAYESGGVFQYVLIDVEENPTVKIFDLRMSQVIQEYYLRISMYMQNNEYLPYKEQLHKDVYTLDYKALGYDEEPVVKSPYSQQDLKIVINPAGDIFIDYTPDLQVALQEGHIYQAGDDIRPILTEDSLFVPAYSMAYTVDENNQPVFMTN